jgi:hypothetical protein
MGMNVKAHWLKLLEVMSTLWSLRSNKGIGGLTVALSECMKGVVGDRNQKCGVHYLAYPMIWFG